MALGSEVNLTCILYIPNAGKSPLPDLEKTLKTVFGPSMRCSRVGTLAALLAAIAAGSGLCVICLDLDSDAAGVWAALEALYPFPQTRVLVFGTPFDRETVSRVAHHGASYLPQPYPQEQVTDLFADLLSPAAGFDDLSPVEHWVRQIGSLHVDSQRRILNRILRSRRSHIESTLELLERATQIETYSSTISESKSGASVRYFLKVPEVKDGVRKRRSSPLGPQDPRVLQPGLPTPSAPQPAPDPHQSQLPCRILCVDDRIGELNLFFQVQMLLEKDAVPGEMIYANDGQTAIDTLRLNPTIQVALLDLDMPGVSGWQILEQLRKLPAIRPVAISGGFTRQQVAGVARYGAAFFPKPCNLKSLALLTSLLVRPREVSVDRAREDGLVREIGALDLPTQDRVLYQALHQQPPGTALDTYRQLEAAETIESLEDGRIAAGKVAGSTYYYLKWSTVENHKRKVRSLCLGKDNPAVLEDPRVTSRISAGVGRGRGRRAKGPSPA